MCNLLIDDLFGEFIQSFKSTPDSLKHLGEDRRWVPL